MLYVTTRNTQDAYTAQRALMENRAPDGGLYHPFHAPHFSPEEIDALLQKPFNQCMAQILSILFKRSVSAWDIDFCIGRYPVRLEMLRHRIVMGELWHNPRWDYDHLVKNLTDHLCGIGTAPGDWVKIAAGIAVLFGLFADLKQAGIETADISVVSGDFSVPMSAWYARKWGLPIGNIVCCCNENKDLWDLICHGQMRTDSVSISTTVPQADVALPEDLERMIYECGGVTEVERYLDACRRGRMYCPSDAVWSKLRSGMYVSVVSSHRVETIVPGVYRTHGYLVSPHTALAYAGLQDYRAKTGQTRHAVILAERGPQTDAEKVSQMIGIPFSEFEQY